MPQHHYPREKQSASFHSGEKKQKQLRIHIKCYLENLNLSKKITASPPRKMSIPTNHKVTEGKLELINVNTDDPPKCRQFKKM